MDLQWVGKASFFASARRFTALKLNRLARTFPLLCPLMSRKGWRASPCQALEVSDFVVRVVVEDAAQTHTFRRVSTSTTGFLSSPMQPTAASAPEVGDARRLPEGPGRPKNGGCLLKQGWFNVWEGRSHGAGKHKNTHPFPDVNVASSKRERLVSPSYSSTFLSPRVLVRLLVCFGPLVESRCPRLCALSPSRTPN